MAHPSPSVDFRSRELSHFQLLDVRVTATDLDRAAATILAWVAEGRQTYVTVTGVHGIMESHDDRTVLDAHLGAGMVVPDGMPLVYLGRMRGENIGRVYGPDLMLTLFERSSPTRPRHFLYGGGEGVAPLLRTRLTERFPQALIVGDFTPPFRPTTPAEDQAIAERINTIGADIVWVGLSTPKQELWMAKMRPHLTAAVLVGVGAAFDFNAGLKPQAPRFLQVLALEWLYRLACEPKRLWRRYLKNNPRFLLLVARQLAHGSRRNQ
jgi:N-acetylglucosaminyldiphosphoundecaprenol N-acetyl-beta-D-mannosaminyltransferase